MTYSQTISYTHVQVLVFLSATTAAAAMFRGKSPKYFVVVKTTRLQTSGEMKSFQAQFEKLPLKENLVLKLCNSQQHVNMPPLFWVSVMLRRQSGASVIKEDALYIDRVNRCISLWFKSSFKNSYHGLDTGISRAALRLSKTAIM